MGRSNKYTMFLLLCGIVIFITGCDIYKNAGPLKSTQQIPATFQNKSDSANVAAVHYRQFFNDSNLVALFDTALRNNFDMLMTMQRMRAAEAVIENAQGRLMPVLNGKLSAGQRKFGKYTMDGVGNYDTNFSQNIEEEQKMPTHLPDYFIGLETSWEIDVWKKLRNLKKSALARYLASVEGRRIVTTNLIAQIAFAYYELLALDNELEIIRETIQIQEKGFMILSIQKEAGEANELAVKQFEAQVLNSKGMEIETRQKIIETENRINFLLGVFPKPVARQKTSFQKTFPDVSTGVPSELLKNRPDIRQAEFALQASNADVKAAKAAFYPSFNITGALGFQAFNAAFLVTTPASIAYNIFGTMVAPLVNRAAIKSEFKTSKANQLEALYQYQKSVLNGYVEVYNELTRIRNLKEIYELQTKQVSVLHESIETASALFRTGRATYLEVLMAQQNALNAKLSINNTRQRQFNAVINLYKALGGGWR